MVDVPSDRAPSGSHGKRVVLTRRATEKAIPSLIGMGVDYSPSLDQHDQKRKVGVITRAELVGRNLEVGGYLYGKDFPEIVSEIGRSLENRLPASGCGLPEFNSSLQLSSLPHHQKSTAFGEGDRLRDRLAAAVGELRAMLKPSVKAAAPLVLRAAADSASRVKAATKKGERLGMSFEVTNVNVLNPSARILRLIDVTFTGAAILRRDKAAYSDTWIELE